MLVHKLPCQLLNCAGKMATGLKMQEENILGSYLDLYGVSCGF
jgi:hypothetical protein